MQEDKEIQNTLKATKRSGNGNNAQAINLIESNGQTMAIFLGIQGQVVLDIQSLSSCVESCGALAHYSTDLPQQLSRDIKILSSCCYTSMQYVNLGFSAAGCRNTVQECPSEIWARIEAVLR